MKIEEFIAKHPQIFHGERPRLGIAIGDGWISLVDELCSAIEARLDNEEFHVVQIKEKCAELRFYFSHQKPEIFSDLIEAAREKSKTICEYCSAAGDLFRIGGTYSTMCEEHARARSDVLMAWESRRKNRDTPTSRTDKKNHCRRSHCTLWSR